MSRPRVIADTETTSLIPDYYRGSGVIWELALVKEDGTEHLWRMQPDLAKADPQALTVGGYYRRTRDMCARCTPDRAHDLTVPRPRSADPEWSLPSAVAAGAARLLDGAVLIGANPAFDAMFLTAFLREHGQAPTWHYALRDIQSMAYGFLRGANDGPLPAVDAHTDEFARALGVDPEKFDRHSALGDCLLVAAMLAKIEGGAS